MRRNRAGEWKLNNVVIEGINLGQTYRSQFASAADQNRGDLDKVIANWKVEPQVADGATKETKN
jgi:phospholipid transport system substrate-binding protein